MSEDVGLAFKALDGLADAVGLAFPGDILRLAC